MPSGVRRHRVTLKNLGAPALDGEGGYQQALVPLTPSDLLVAIESPGGDDERLAPGTVVTASTRIVTGPFHPQVSTATVLEFKGRALHVVGVVNVDERDVQMVLTCEERGAAALPVEPASYIQAVLRDGPIGYWRLNDVEATVAEDASGANHPGAYAGGVTVGEPGALSPANGINFAARFNGIDGQVTCPAPELARDGLAPVSAEVWAKRVAGTDYGGLLGTVTKGFFLIWDTGWLGFYAGNGGLVSILSNTVAAGWHHIVGTWDGTLTAGAIKLYVDGALVASANPLNGSEAGTCRIGNASAVGGSAFNGWLDEVAVYAIALTADQVRFHYDQGVKS